MGEIISSKSISDESILLRIKLEKEEILSLKNAIKNINVFSSDQCINEANLITRGKNGVTQYFEIPFNLRMKRSKDYDNLYYQKIETKTKVFIIYTLKKKLL